MKKTILGLSLVLLACPVLAKTSTATQWHLASKQWIVDVRVDDFTDEKKVEGHTLQSSQKKPVSIFCSKDKEVLIGLSGGAYNSDSEFYQAKVRVDTGEPFEVSVMGGSHGRWHYLENNDEWAEAFKAGNNAILKTEGWDYETKVVKFNLNNFDEAYNAVVENCK